MMTMVLLLLPLVDLGEQLDEGVLVVGRPLQHVIVDHVIQFHFSIKTDKGLRTESWDVFSVTTLYSIAHDSILSICIK